MLLKSLNKSLILPTLVVCAVASIIFSASQFYKVEKHTKETTMAYFFTTVEAGYDIVDTTVNESIKSYLKAIAITTDHAIKAGQDKRSSFIKKNSAIDSYVDNFHIGKQGYIYILDKKGKLVYHPYLKGGDVSENKFIQTQLTKQRSYIQYTWRNPVDNTYKIKVAYSLKTVNGLTIVVTAYKDDLLHLVNQKLLKEKLAQYKYGEDGYVYLTDSTGKLLLHPTAQGQPLSKLIGDCTIPFILEAKEKKEGLFTYPITIDGEKHIKTVAYKYYPYLDWIIASGISHSELTQPTDMLKHSAAIALITLSIIILLLVVILNTRHKRLIEAEQKDYLTGLNNRRRFMRLAADKVIHAQTKTALEKKPTIVLFDVDKFKLVNDTYGHQAGDVVLKAVAEVFKRYESEHVLASRHGGEEFIILTTQLTKEQAFDVAQSIRKDIQACETLCCPVTISGGLFYLDDPEVGLDMAIHNADEALYQAKNNGRNQICVYNNIA